MYRISTCTRSVTSNIVLWWTTGSQARAPFLLYVDVCLPLLWCNAQLARVLGWGRGEVTVEAEEVSRHQLEESEDNVHIQKKGGTAPSV